MTVARSPSVNMGSPTPARSVIAVASHEIGQRRRQRFKSVLRLPAQLPPLCRSLLRRAPYCWT